MKWNREEYIELMTFGRVERQMFVELFGPLLGLEDEWRAQGATEDEVNLTAFDFDWVQTAWCGVNTWLCGGYKSEKAYAVAVFFCDPFHDLTHIVGGNKILMLKHLRRTSYICNNTVSTPFRIQNRCS